MKHLYLILFLGLSIASNAQIPTPSCGKIERLPMFKSSYVDARNIDILLPNGYSHNKKYAVIYMHDGQMLYDSTVTWNKQEWMVDETLEKMSADSSFKEAIVVGIWNNGKYRHSEYFPQKPAESLSPSLQEKLLPLIQNKLQADSYLKFIVKELKPYIDSHYSTFKGRKSTFIAGSSMGGLISMYAICEYPNVFGGAACLSTHWIGTFDGNLEIPNAFVNYLSLNLPSPKSHKIYFDYGTETLDSHYKPSQLRVDSIMKSKGYTSKNWITLEFVGANHSERAWQKRLHIPFIFLLKK